MVETAAHLADHVFPRLPVRQWVLSVPKRLRYFMQRDGAVLNIVLRIFLRVIAQTLQTHSPGAANVDKATLHIGAVAFIHRFGSSLNGHVHFHVCAVDGVFEEVPVAVALAGPAKPVVVQTDPAATGEGVPAVVPLGHAMPPTPEPALRKRSPAHYLWAVLIARIYEVFPLMYPICGGQMRLIAFITEGAQIRRILDHISVDSEPPHISPTLRSISASVGGGTK